MSAYPSSRMSAWLERAWLTRYLDRNLEETELAWFEAYLLDKPDLLQPLEADTLLRDALAGAGRDALSVSTPRTPRLSRAWQGVAAALVIGLAVGWLGHNAHSPTAEQLIPNPTPVRFDLDRGSTPTPEPAAPSASKHQGAVSSPYFLVEIAVPYDAKDIHLLVGSGKPIALQPSVDGFVTFIWKRSTANSETIHLRYISNKIVHERSFNIPEHRGG